MTTINNRSPVTLRPATTASQAAEARPAVATAKTAAVNAMDKVGISSFQANVAKAAPAQPIPGAWRGGPDTEVGKAIAGMINRMRSSDAAGIQIKGDTIESLFTRAIIDNKHVTNDQLLAMSKIKLEQLADGPEDSAKILKAIPDAREQPVHKFTVAMLAAATGVDPKALSEASPGLGMTGAPDVFVIKPPTAGLERSTALHDFTDYLRGAGLKGMNKAVWGVENRVLSAIVSAVGGGRY